MAGTPREHGKEKGFWDGGSSANDKNGETAGRASGYPGLRNKKRAGIKTDMEFPEQAKTKA